MRHGPVVATVERYARIRDYAAIGDCHGGALVARGGSVDWCCLRRFDADPVFCRLLDAERGGYFAVRPGCEHTIERAYAGPTNILRTVFSTSVGKFAVTDFMPLGRRPGARAHDYVTLAAPHWLVRVVEGLEGRVPLEVLYRPSVEFARRAAALRRSDGCIESDDGTCLYADLAFDLDGDAAIGHCTLAAGERRPLVVTAGPAQGWPPARAAALLEVTRAFWEEWIAYCRYRGPYREAVRRSALALKLLTYAPSGAIAAAMTTSLPEHIGGTRNWDYRFCWLRDATMTLYGLAALGYGGEARRFSEYLKKAIHRTWPKVQIMYGIDGETELAECTLEHLEGYRGSRPVRTGNEAYRQHQIDTYGEVLDWALLYRALGGRFDAGMRAVLEALVTIVGARWQDPDQGLWEMRGPPRHFVHGKLMSWAAVDRAIRLLGRRRNWEALRDRIAVQVRDCAIDPQAGQLRGAYEPGIGLDASLLLAPMLGFPVEPKIVAQTVDEVQRALGCGRFLRRYACPDGVEGEEGAFLICSFWMVDALLCTGREDQARALFEDLLGCANDVGLYAEEIDPVNGEFLGNFPQAFTHLALAGSAVTLDLHRRKGATALAGAHADRARRGVAAVLGWRAIVAAMIQCGRVGRLFASARSVLAADLYR